MPQCNKAHANKQRPMRQHADLTVPKGASSVAHRDIDQLIAQPDGAKQQIEVSKRIEIGCNRIIIAFKQGFCSAEGIGDILTEQPAKSDAKENIAKTIQPPHGAVFLRIDKACPVGKPTFTGYERIIKLGHILRGNGNVTVQDHEYVTSS